MKLECRIVLRCVRKIILNIYSKDDVCATVLGKVAVCPTIHRSADRCQQCQIHYSMTILGCIFGGIAYS